MLYKNFEHYNEKDFGKLIKNKEEKGLPVVLHRVFGPCQEELQTKYKKKKDNIDMGIYLNL